MSGIIEFPNPNTPDNDCSLTVGNRIYYKFSVNYGYGDKEFAFEIWAQNRHQAEERIKAIRGTAELQGQIYSEVD